MKMNEWVTDFRLAPRVAGASDRPQWFRNKQTEGKLVLLRVEQEQVRNYPEDEHVSHVSLEAHPCRHKSEPTAALFNESLRDEPVNTEQTSQCIGYIWLRPPSKEIWMWAAIASQISAL
jgi:hypothetical protein